MRAFYSEYVNHCLRFYARHPRPIFHSEADKKNWNACESALKTFNDYERAMLMIIYSEGDTIADNVYQLAKARNMKQDTLWKLINDLERKVAKRRGLI